MIALFFSILRTSCFNSCCLGFNSCYLYSCSRSQDSPTPNYSRYNLGLRQKQNCSHGFIFGGLFEVFPPYHHLCHLSLTVTYRLCHLLNPGPSPAHLPYHPCHHLPSARSLKLLACLDRLFTSLALSLVWKGSNCNRRVADAWASALVPIPKWSSAHHFSVRSDCWVEVRVSATPPPWE